METSEDILVIFLSTFLAIFLILGIIFLYKSIQILNILKRISEKAEQLADKAEAVGEFVQKTAGSIGIIRLLSNIVNVMQTKKGKEDKDE